MNKCFVITKKSSLMQRIADLVRTGHTQYVTGEISKEKLEKFYERMNQLYEVNQSAMAASRKRKSGKAGFRLLVGLLNNNEKFTFFLLRTTGEICESAKNEYWQDALKNKIEVTGYNLLRKSRKDFKNPSWTWGYTKEQYQMLYDNVTLCIRKREDFNLTFYIDLIAKTQGFAVARTQAFKLRKLIIDEWKKHRGKEPMPELPNRIGYNRRLATLGNYVEVLNKKRAIRKPSH